MASAGSLDGKAPCAFDDESFDLAVNIGALTRAIAALEECVAGSLIHSRIGPAIRKIANTTAIQDRIVEEFVDVRVPQMMEEMSGVVKLIPQEQVQQCAAEQRVDRPIAQIDEEIVEAVKVFLMESGKNIKATSRLKQRPRNGLSKEYVRILRKWQKRTLED